MCFGFQSTIYCLAGTDVHLSRFLRASRYGSMRFSIVLTQAFLCLRVSYFFQVFDLSSPAESENSAPGCALTDGVCLTAGGPSCGVHGKCLGEWGSFSCDCQPGYSGHKCDKGKPTQYVSLHGLYLMTVTVIICHNNNTIIPHFM